MLTNPTYFIEFSYGLGVWLLWVSIIVVLISLSLSERKSDHKLDRIGLVWLAVLSILILVTSVFGGISINSTQIELFPLESISGKLPQLMILVAVPWMLTVCFVGTFPAVALAIASGFLYAFLETHSMFTPLYFGSVALLFGYLMKKRFASNLHKKNEQPLVNSLIVIIILSPLLLLMTIVDQDGSLVERVINSLSMLKIKFFIYGIEIIIGGLVCQVLSKLIIKRVIKNSFSEKRIDLKRLTWIYSFVWLGILIITISVFWSEIYLLDEQRTNIPFSLGSGLILLSLSLIGWYKVVLPQEISHLAIRQIENMRSRKNYNLPEFSRKGIKNNDLLDSLEDLRKYVSIQTDINQRLLQLNPGLGNDIENVLASILRTAMGSNASAARIILLEKISNQGTPTRRTRVGLGIQHKLYAYLDEIVINKIGNLKRLVLSDLKDEQLFELTPGMPYPVSLIALALISNETTLGYLWIGFDNNQWFSEDDIAFYDILAQRASLAIQNSIISIQEQSQRLKFETILNSIPDPVLLLDQMGVVLYSNEAALKISEISKLGFASFPSELINDDSLSALIKQTKYTPLTKPIRLASNLEFNATVCKISIEAGEERILLILNDLSSIRKINLQKSEFVTTVSHGLRKYLSMINGYVTILPNIGNLSQQQLVYIQRIITEIYGMQKLVDNVLNLEHLDTDKPLQLTSITIKELILSAIKPLELLAQQKKISLDVQYNGSENRKIIVDPTLMQQALLNLVDNAIKYSTMGSKVDTIISMDQEKTTFVVKDQGVGIAPLDVPKLFEKYFHVESSSYQQHQGSGLGLAIVRSIAEKHGGKVWVISQLGKGSTFSIEVPVIDEYSISE
ncbi:MAG: ATP-binding protein [Anaerolineaceae bacterium]|nr:ATP-binding protein [Anaerolineaceae bacterium]